MRSLKIAQVAPLCESVPPKLYGGTERVVSYLTEELIRAGHQVTLFASGDSRTAAQLVAVCPQALWRSPDCRDTLPHHVRMMELVRQCAPQFDILHFHCDFLHLPLVRQLNVPNVTTLHGHLDAFDAAPLIADFAEVPLVAISDAQRRTVPSANWQATIHHGLPRALHRLHMRPDNYLVFLGRVSAEKGVDRAVEIAVRSGLPLKITGKIHPEDREYFLTCIAPLLKRHHASVEFIGEITEEQKGELLGNARALLFPIAWPEPFGLVMVEALACGTPVIAWRDGSVPEIIDDGVTGFIVESVDQAVTAVARLERLNRLQCRLAFEGRFDASGMTRNYESVYRKLIHQHEAALVTVEGCLAAQHGDDQLLTTSSHAPG